MLELRRLDEAHPRWRGEDCSSGFPFVVVEGSSPLARGGLREPPGWVRRKGLIPAGAGRTSRRGDAPSQGSAHPRWRGEDITPWMLTRADEGSSPLARGGLMRPPRRACRRGLIPAGAGRTVDLHATLAALAAHPRWRGEDRGVGPGGLGLSGSSPLARGGLVDAVDDGASVRLIPAGAGRTS